MKLATQPALDVPTRGSTAGEEGLLVRPSKATTSALEDVIALGHEGRRRLGRAARARVTEFFEVGLIARKYEAIYEETYEKHKNVRKVS